MLILGNDLKLNVQFAMCTVLMWRTLCEKLIDTTTLSHSLTLYPFIHPSIKRSSFFSRFCTHSLDYLGESSSDNSRIVIGLRNGMDHATVVSIVLDFIGDQTTRYVHDHWKWNLRCFCAAVLLHFRVWICACVWVSENLCVCECVCAVSQMYS